MSDVAAPLSRALQILKTIGTHGPIRLVDLEHKLGLSKSILHRFCAQLEDQHWIRKRVADKAYIVTHHLDEFFANAVFSRDIVDILHPVLVNAKAAQIYHLAISAFETRSVFSTLEGTRAPSHWDQHHSLVFSPAAIAMQAAMDPMDRFKAVSGNLNNETPEAVALVKSGAHAQTIRDVIKLGSVVDTNLPALHFGIDDDLLGYFTISVEPVSQSKAVARQFIRDAADIKTNLLSQIRDVITAPPAVTNQDV